MIFELGALDEAGEYVEILQNFLIDILFWLKALASVCIHFDSQDAIGRAWNMMSTNSIHSHNEDNARELGYNIKAC